MLDDYARGVDRTIGLLLLTGERMFLGGFGGFAGVGVDLLQALVAGVSVERHARMHARLALLEEVKIMASAFAHAHGQDASGALLQEHLCLQGVALFLA